MLGYAMGAMGMSLGDFRRMTPGDFSEACKAYRRKEGARVRGEWERARTLAIFSAQPHCRKRLDPKKLMPLPWDKKKAPKPKQESRKESSEEAKARYEKLLANAQR